MNVAQDVTFVVVMLGGLSIAILGERLGRKLKGRPKRLKGFYMRLGQVAPDDQCPCIRATSTGRAYKDCCRPDDVEELEREVRQFIWENWMRRSGGRRRTASMRMRLKNFPIPEASLPGWVTHPADHGFPVPEDDIRAWTPLLDKSGIEMDNPEGAGLGGDLPL